MSSIMLPEDVDALSDYELQRELDKVKARVFLGENAAFLGSIMSSMDFVWDKTLNPPTAATNGETFWFHPHFFFSMEPDTRKTVLVHELWHAALLHMVRMGDRDPLIWNYACDIRINNGLELDGFTFKGVEDCWKDQSYGLQAEEDIYETLLKNQPPPPSPAWGPGPCTPNGSGGPTGNPQAGPGTLPDPNGVPGGIGDMVPVTKASTAAAINNVVTAIHQAKLAGQPGSIPGGLEQMIEKFLAPVINWKSVFYRWMEDLLEDDYTWRRPNRRHHDIYLPSRFTDDGRLQHLIYYLDTSGSISAHDLIRFNSEVKYIWDTFKPSKLTVVQFDTIIQKEDVFEGDDLFERIKISGRGGTCLIPVRDHIIEHSPTAAIIFSDLYVAPMKPLPKDIPIVWATQTQNATVPFGTLVYIREK